MPRYILNLMGEGLVIDMRAHYFDSLLDAYQEALYGDWEALRCIGDDGREIPADSVEIYDDSGKLILTFWVKGAFTEH